MDYAKWKEHFGHIVLALPVVNPICLKKLKCIVKHICKECNRIVIIKHISRSKITSRLYRGFIVWPYEHPMICLMLTT